jgi:hypothetical protein
MTTPRTTREAETRSHEMLEIYDLDYANPLSIPPGVAKEGYVYHWARKDIRGESDYRVEVLASQGWTPVPTERMNKAFVDPLGRNPLAQQFSVFKDVLLMERPEMLSKRATAKFNELNANKLKSLRGVSNDIGSFASPINSINSF